MEDIMEQVVDDFYAERVLNRRAEKIAERDRLLENCEKMIEYYKSRIEEITDEYSNRISYDEALLRTYFELVPTKETATQKTYKLPSGTLKVTKAKKDFEPDKDKMLTYFKVSRPDLVKVKEEPDWASFKKELTIDGDTVINQETGEVIDCVAIIDKPESFSIK